MFDFNTAMSDWETGPKISTLIDFGPWWYYENEPSERDVVMAGLAEELLRIGYVSRETWFNAGSLITRYKVTRAGTSAMKEYQDKLDKKFAKIYADMKKEKL